MPKGKEPKPTFLKPAELPRNPEEKLTDTLSPVDKGWDFVKPGETTQIGH